MPITASCIVAKKRTRSPYFAILGKSKKYRFIRTRGTMVHKKNSLRRPISSGIINTSKTRQIKVNTLTKNHSKYRGVEFCFTAFKKALSSKIASSYASPRSCAMVRSFTNKKFEGPKLSLSWFSRRLWPWIFSSLISTSACIFCGRTYQSPSNR